MLAIAISALLLALAGLAGWTIVTSLAQGWAIARAIMAELGGQKDCAATVPAFRPLRGRAVISQQGYSRRPVRLRPLRRAAAA